MTHPLEAIMGQPRTPPSLSSARGARQDSRPPRAALLGAVLAASSAMAALTLGRQTLLTWPGTDTTSTEGALLALALIASTALTAWVSVVLMLAVHDLVRDGRAGLQPSRPRSRTIRWTSAALLALTTTPSPAALASTPEPSWTMVSSDAVAGSTSTSETAPPPEQRLLPDGSPVPLPGWTPTPSPPPAKPTAVVGLVSVAPREAPPEHVVVRAGDTLWSIAARQLGPSATVQDVAEEWPRWYAANRGTIGTDPDLILPGQELRIPGPGSAASPSPNEGAGR